MLEQIWNWFLEQTALLVTPDWGSIIALLPVGVMALVLVWLFLTFRRFRAQPPARRGKQRIEPRTPAGIHMPGPSFSPVFAAIGAALLLFGLVYGGWVLVLGGIALVLSLLYWLAEGLRTYDRDTGSTALALPATVHDGPPPGVHMPGPSFRPFVGAVGMMILMFGLVYGGWLLLAGVLSLVFTLVGWLVDAVGEYGQVARADTTGHLENLPAPRTPSLLLSVLAVLFVGGVLLQTGILPPKSGSVSAVTPGGSAAPSGVSSSAKPAGSSTPASSGATGDVSITAQGVAFLDTAVSGPAGKPFTIAFSNQDAGTAHDVDIKDASGGDLFKGEIFPGVATKVYAVPAIPAGTYTFVCFVHPNMTGSITLK